MGTGRRSGSNEESPMPLPIEEQVVVITGASSGIGRAAALEFAARGASVVAAARTDEALTTLIDEIHANGGVAEAVPTDVANWDEVEALAAAAVARFERVDTWI